MSARAAYWGRQKIPRLLVVVFVVLFGLARVKSCMGEAFTVMSRIEAVARRRLRERILIFLQLQRMSSTRTQLDNWIVFRGSVCPDNPQCDIQNVQQKGRVG